MEELLKYLGFTAPLIYAGAAYGFFHWLDENASDEAKAALARTMRFKDYKNEQVASALVQQFDRIYTYPLLRWRAFFRSVLFTTAVLVIYVFEVYLPAMMRWIVELGLDQRWEMSFWLWFLGAFVKLFLYNVFTDYLSLFVIRPVLQHVPVIMGHSLHS
jgi:hypothetical protein